MLVFTCDLCKQVHEFEDPAASLLSGFNDRGAGHSRKTVAFRFPRDIGQWYPDIKDICLQCREDLRANSDTAGVLAMKSFVADKQNPDARPG